MNVTAMAIPPRASWRRPERSIGRPVQPAHHHAAGQQRHGGEAQGGGKGGQAREVRQQRDERPGGERDQRRDAGHDRRGQLERVDAEFLAGMHAQRRIGVPRDRGGHPGGGLRVGAVADERVRQLGLLGVREPGVHLAFGGDLGMHQLVLVRHRHVLPGAHRERSCDQGGHAGQYHGVRRCPAPAQPGDQRSVGHQPVYRAEHRRPQPASGYVAMPVRPPGCECRLADRIPVFMHLLAHPQDYPPGTSAGAFPASARTGAPGSRPAGRGCRRWRLERRR